MRAEISSAVHKHKVAPEGKGPGRDLGPDTVDRID